MSPVKAEKKEIKDIVRLIDIFTGSDTDAGKGPHGKASLLPVLEELKKIIKFDAATLYQVDLKDDSLHKIASLGGDVELLGQFTLAAGTGISSWTADSKRPILIADRTGNKNYNPDTDYASFLSVPILQNGLVIGVLNLGSYTPRRFSEEDLHLLEPVSGLFSLVIEKAALQNTVSELNIKLKRSSVEKERIEEKSVDLETVEELSSDTSKIIHEINNALSIVFGNIQCILMGENGINQKTMSRLRRVEDAAKTISQSNQKILEIHGIINKEESITGNFANQELNIDE